MVVWFTEKKEMAMTFQYFTRMLMWTRQFLMPISESGRAANRHSRCVTDKCVVQIFDTIIKMWQINRQAAFCKIPVYS